MSERIPQVRLRSASATSTTTASPTSCGATRPPATSRTGCWITANSSGASAWDQALEVHSVWFRKPKKLNKRPENVGSQSHSLRQSFHAELSLQPFEHAGSPAIVGLRVQTCRLRGAGGGLLHGLRPMGRSKRGDPEVRRHDQVAAGL